MRPGRPPAMVALALLALTLFAGSCGPGPAASPDRPEGFHQTWRVTADAPQVRRVVLPPAALLAIRRADAGDIRIFDAGDRPLALALVPASPGPAQVIRLTAVPFGVSGHDPMRGDVSVRVDRSGGAVSVTTGEGRPASDSHAVLLDTRRLTGPAHTLTLVADLPVQQPIAVTIAASTDLSHWAPLAEQTLFRVDRNAPLLGGGAIELGGQTLAGRYLRVSWSGASGAMVTGGDVTIRASDAPPPVSVPASGARLIDAHHLRFVMPPGLAPLALRVTMRGQDGVVPLTLRARRDVEAPWTTLALASLRQGGMGAMLALGPQAWREFSLEADPRTAGFSQAPGLAFDYPPLAVLAAFNGAGPYRLAVGNPAAPATFLNPADLAPGPGPWREARVAGQTTPATLQLGDPQRGGPVATRVIVLWALLIGGVVVLLAAAAHLWRSAAAPGAER